MNLKVYAIVENQCKLLINLIYNQSIEERDRRMKTILSGLKERGIYKKDSFPYRRGCIEPHEKLIGPWEKWFDINKDYIL